MFSVTNGNEFIRGLDSWLDQTEKELLDVYRGFNNDIFHQLLLSTPQWSGNAVSNWNYVVGGHNPGITFEQLKKVDTAVYRLGSALKYHPFYQKGDLTGIQLALSRNRGGPDALTSLGMSVRHENDAQTLSHESYIEMLEENPNSFLRPVNFPGEMVHRVSLHFQDVEALSEQQQRRYQQLELGDLFEFPTGAATTVAGV